MHPMLRTCQVHIYRLHSYSQTKSYGPHNGICKDIPFTCHATFHTILRGTPPVLTPKAKFLIMPRLLIKRANFTKDTLFLSVAWRLFNCLVLFQIFLAGVSTFPKIFVSGINLDFYSSNSISLYSNTAGGVKPVSTFYANRLKII